MWLSRCVLIRDLGRDVDDLDRHVSDVWSLFKRIGLFVLFNSWPLWEPDV